MARITLFSQSGGGAVLHGKIAYRDFIDTKPPLIFSIYGIAELLFGHHEYSIRIVDLVYQLFALGCLYLLLVRTTKDSFLATISVVLYAIVYAGSGFEATAQPETFALLPSVAVLWSVNAYREGRLSSVGCGLIFGISAMIFWFLKFTLVVPVAAGIASLWLIKPRSQRIDWKLLSVVVSIVVLFVGSYVVYLAALGGLHHFSETIGWLRGYASYAEPLPSGAHVASGASANIFPHGLLMEYGMSVTVLFALGLYIIVVRRRQLAPIYLDLVLQALFGLAVIMYERKAFPYFFSRILFAVIPIAAFALINILKEWEGIRSLVKVRQYSHALVGAGLFLFAGLLGVYYSPIVRIAKQSVQYAKMTLSGKSIAPLVQSQEPDYVYSDQKILADSLRAWMRPDDKLFVWGKDVGLYFFANCSPSTLCLNGEPYTTPTITPADWRTEIMDSLRVQHPRFVVLRNDEPFDNHGDLGITYWFDLRRWPDLEAFIGANYQVHDTVGHFTVYKLNDMLRATLPHG